MGKKCVRVEKKHLKNIPMRKEMNKEKKTGLRVALNN